MKRLSLDREIEITRFIEKQLDGADITSLRDLMFYLNKLPGICSPFYPGDWPLKRDAISEEEVARIESGKRILEVLIKEAPVIGFTRIGVAYDRDDETHHYKSYSVIFHLCGYHMNMKTKKNIKIQLI